MKKITTVALLLYSFFITVLVVRYKYIMNRDYEDKNNLIEWNIDATECTLSSKKTELPSSVFIDKNRDINFERSYLYSPNGSLVVSYFDKNEDGYVEHFEFYNSQSEFVMEFFDDNNDGVINRLCFVNELKDTIYLRDKNGNGYFDSSISYPER